MRDCKESCGNVGDKCNFCHYILNDLYVEKENMKKICEELIEKFYCVDKQDIEEHRVAMARKGYTCTSIAYAEDSNKEYNLVMGFVKKL